MGATAALIECVNKETIFSILLDDQTTFVDLVRRNPLVRDEFKVSIGVRYLKKWYFALGFYNA